MALLDDLQALRTTSAPLKQADIQLGHFLDACIEYIQEIDDENTTLAARVTTLETALTALTVRVHALDGL